MIQVTGLRTCRRRPPRAPCRPGFSIVCRFCSPTVTAGAILFTAIASSAANVHFEIVPLIDGEPVDLAATPEITIAPGDPVAYEITALVAPTDPAASDNDGLAFFRFDILTDLGVPQPSADGFEETIHEVFTLLRSLGTSSADDLIKIQAAQDTVIGRTPLLTGVAQQQAQVLVGGILATPAIEGTFHVALGGDVQASVFETGGSGRLETATTTVGTGFAVHARFGSSKNQHNDQSTGDTGDGNDEDTTGTDDGSTVDVTPQPGETSANTGLSSPIALGGIAVALGVLSAWAFLSVGPIAGAVALLVALATALAYFLTRG